jgi:hypothetical protein
MMEMNSAPPVGFGAQLDPDDLIDYDEDDTIGWPGNDPLAAPPAKAGTDAHDPEAQTLSSAKLGDPAAVGADLSLDNATILDEDLGLGEHAVDGLPGGVGSVEFEEIGYEELSDSNAIEPAVQNEIDWQVEDDKMYDTLYAEPSSNHDSGNSAEADLEVEGHSGEYHDDEILYEEGEEEQEEGNFDTEIQAENGTDGDDAPGADQVTEDSSHGVLLSPNGGIPHSHGSSINHATPAASPSRDEDAHEITYEEEDEYIDDQITQEYQEEELGSAEYQEFSNGASGVGGDTEVTDREADEALDQESDSQSYGEEQAEEANYELVEDETEDAGAGEKPAFKAGFMPSAVPLVSVYYRGEEFPLFQGARGSGDKMPFFAELAPLEYTMDALLSSFRQELAGEVRPNDDLVFQVDELGLEFSDVSLV